MATKNTKKTKTRVSKTVKKKNTDKKLFIALSLLVIVIVAVVGIVYYRQSQAARTAYVSRTYDEIVGGLYSYDSRNGRFIAVSDFSTQDDPGKRCLYLANQRAYWCHAGRSSQYQSIVWARKGDNRCATIVQRGNAGGSKFNYGGEKEFRAGNKVVVFEYGEGRFGCNPGNNRNIDLSR